MAFVVVLAWVGLALPLDASARVHPIDDKHRVDYGDCLQLQNEIDEAMSALTVASAAARQAKDRIGVRAAFELARWEDVIAGIGNRIVEAFKKWNKKCPHFGSPLKTGPTCQLEDREGDEVPVSYSRRRRLGDPRVPSVSRA